MGKKEGFNNNNLGILKVLFAINLQMFNYKKNAL